MVSTRDKKRTSNETVGKNEVDENDLTKMQTSDSLKAKLEECMLDAQVKYKVDITVEDAKNENYEETYGKKEGDKLKEVENDDGNKISTETNGDEMEQLEKSASEDNERDDQDAIWEDDSEDSEEYDLGEDGVSEEEEIEELVEDENDDEVNDDEGIGEEDDEEVEVSEQEAMEEKLDLENTQDGKEITEEDERDTKEHNTAKAKLSLKKIETSSQRRKKNRARRRKKVSPGDKPESSSKTKAKKKVESMGMIFMCSSKTKDDCYKYGVLGLPESKKDLVIKIYSGMRLFLYDVDLKLLYGIYKAAGPGGYNIEPKAFKSQFPSQVRFTVLDDCLPLAEEKFKKLIKDNYYTKTKFDGVLNLQQVKALCKLFIASSKGRKSTKLSRSRKGAKSVRKGKASSRRVGDKRRLRSREELQYEHPRKRPKEVISPVALLRRAPSPPPTGPSYAIVRTSDVDAYRRDPYLETRSPYRERQNPVSSRRDPCRDRRCPPTERHDYYRDGRSTYLERQYPHRDSLNYIDRTDRYRDGSSAYPESRGQDLYLDPGDTFRDDRNPYSYRDGQDLYLDRYGSYSSTYKRDPLPERHEVYREGQGLEFRDPYRRDELLDRRDLPLSLETRRQPDIGSHGSYVSYRARLPHPEPIYSADYPPRASLVRHHRL